MGYTIRIGNAESDALTCEDYDGEYQCRVYVPGVQNSAAPNLPYDWMTGQSNDRSPSYSGWAEFMDVTGLRGLFKDPATGIMRSHPGCFAITAEHLATVRAAKAKYEADHPGAVPGFNYDPQWPKKDEFDDGVRDRDYWLARLVWLEWWMAWALENCERPAIYNS